MFIQLQKYCWNSLRKGRLLGFENDIEQTYTVFKNHMLQPQQITVQQFELIANNSQFCFIVHCRAQEQDEQEYIQLLYQILIDNYFMTEKQPKQIFSIYALYYIYAQLQRKRKINVDKEVIDSMLRFITNNTKNITKNWMIIAKKIVQNCLSIGIKTGLKTYLIRPNGEPARKGRYNLTNKRIEIKQEEVQKEKQLLQQQMFMASLKSEISSLETNLKQYCEMKQKFNSELNNSQNKLIFSDKNLGVRLFKKYTQFEKLLGQTITDQN